MTYGTTLIKYNQFTGFYSKFGSLYSEPIHLDIAIDKDGNKWFISEEGLFIINEDQIVSINNNHEIVSDFRLYQNYLNPFNPSTEIEYEIGDMRFVTLTIYDVQGREVETLVYIE